MNSSEIKSKTKYMLEFTPKELFVIQMSLERFSDIDDREFRKPTKVAGKLLGRLPETGLKWDDVS